MSKSSGNRSRPQAARAKRADTSTVAPRASESPATSGLEVTQVELKPTNRDGIGRIPVTDVFPVIDEGHYPAKAVVGELFPVQATVFREGHDAVRASVILTDPEGRETRTDMVPTDPVGFDRWEGWVRVDSEGDWTFRVEGWSSPWDTWKHNAEAKLPLGMDLELVCLEGKELFQRAAEIAAEAEDKSAEVVLRATAELMATNRDADDLLEAINIRALTRAMSKHAPRELVSPTGEYPVWVTRKRALFSSWYEFFPRSQGAHYDPVKDEWTSGTFRDCFDRLEAAAKMGFDIVYLPPIHPIGDAFRKGKNNTLTPAPGDPGSCWAIGSAAGGHDAVHPDLGTLADFDAFVAKAQELGLEVALDFALQCSPDHPWAVQHPEWFSTRADGTIAYAENPPKKYQDIYPLNFDNDPEGIYRECLRILEFWIDRGVTVFRVDNPHTKPVDFWSWILAEVHRKYPQVIFLAEAFTRPAMMQTLGKVGFDQGYTYFTWRNSKAELEEYLTEVSSQTAHQFRPNFFTNTPDINPLFVRSGNPAAFSIRTILATTMSPSWGMYSGWELFEHAPLKEGGEEYLDSEKYEFRPRDFDAEPNLNVLIGMLNKIRRKHPALQQLRQVHIHQTNHSDVIAFSKRDLNDQVIVICSLSPDYDVETTVSLDLAAMGYAPDAVLSLRDELTGKTYKWGAQNYVRLSPFNPAHIMSVELAK